MENIKILVVDDESRMRKLVRDFLTREGYTVLEAGDGMEAMDVFYEDKDIALIILDVMMPKMDGWQVCREIRESSKVPIIMLTARSEERDELQHRTQALPAFPQWYPARGWYPAFRSGLQAAWRLRPRASAPPSRCRAR